MSPEAEAGPVKDEPGGPATLRPDRAPTRVRTARFAIALVVVASLPVLAGVAERLNDGWQPQGDEAVIAWLTRDVLTSDSPLLGMPTTIGHTADDDAEVSPPHHWGPMQFWVLAVPQRLASDNPAGLQAGLLAFEVATVAGIVVFALRRSGRLGTLALLVPLTAAMWSLGRTTLSSIWNPDVSLLPLAFLLVTVWSLAEGDSAALPFAAVAASFVAQSNILYTPLVAVLVAWGAAGFAISRRESHDGDGDDGGGRTRLRRPIVATCVVLLVCWGSVLIEEIANRPGNVERVLQHALDEGGDHVGLTRATHVLARAVGGVPFWSHPLDSDRAALGLLARPSLATATLAIGLGVLMLTVFVRAWRRDPRGRALLGTALCGLAGSTLTTARLPLSFGVPPYRLRSFWITGSFALFAVAWVAGRRLAPMVTGAPLARARRLVPAGLAIALVAFATLGAAGRGQTPATRDASAIVDDLARTAAADLPDDGPYLAIKNVSPLRGIATGVLWGLERRGIDIRFPDEADSFAETYLSDLHGADGQSMPRLVLIDNASGYEPRDGERLVAHVEGSARRDDLIATLGNRSAARSPTTP
ncbi:MAG: hypothetical protein M5T61_05335 [Acidimicrobiia bacterium]|nr:hypothetical protein [Acidimicrobiia bacterium]